MRCVTWCAGKSFAVTISACCLLSAALFAAEGKPPTSRQGGASSTSTATAPPSKVDVAYGPHARNVLDFWQAKSDKPTPLVVFMHSGSFIWGDKAKIRSRPIIAALLEKGVSFASINYRLREDAPVEDILRDAARAIQFLRYHAQDFNIDKPRIAMYGESAGAGTSLWLAVHPDLADPGSSDPVLRESSRPAAAISVNGQATYDFTQWPKLIGPYPPEWLFSPDEIVRLYYFKSEADFQTPEGRKILQDCDMLHWLSRDSAPIFMFSNVPNTEPTNRSDYVHHPRQMVVVKRQADAVGAQCTMVMREDLGNVAEHYKLLLEFIYKHLHVN